jgi:hypothetical protein
MKDEFTFRREHLVELMKWVTCAGWERGMCASWATGSFSEWSKSARPRTFVPARSPESSPASHVALDAVLMTKRLDLRKD